MLKILITIFLVSYCLHATCQEATKYYDNFWKEAPAEKAVYYAKFVKDGAVYKFTSYWKDNNTVRGKATYLDTTLSSPDGEQVMYDRKGHLEDSTYYEDGIKQFSYHYYPNGQVAVHYHLPYGKKEGVTETFNEEGKKIKDFIMAKEAEFNGGENAWRAYLKKNTDKDLAVRRNKDGTAPSVEVEFAIDEEGQVTNPKITRSSGFKNVDKDALRIISDSPKWSPAISYNKAIKAYKVETVTYDIPAP